MQDNNGGNNINNRNMNRQQRPVQRPGQNGQRPVQNNPQRMASNQGRPVNRMPGGQPNRPVNGKPNGQPNRPVNGVPNGQQTRSAARINNGQERRPVASEGQNNNISNQQQRRMSGSQGGPRKDIAAGNKVMKKSNTAVKSAKSQNLTPKQQARKKRNKILLFIALIFALLVLIIVSWGMSHANKMIVDIEVKDPDKIGISPEIQKQTEEGVMKGYRNIALFGVDSRDNILDKGTRTDVMMIVSINLDTKEIKLVSVLRDTWLNLGTDKYGKANSAYAKGGPDQAITMLNKNLDMNITDFVTTGFKALIDVIDAVGGIEIDVKESEIVHINSFQISMAGKPDGTFNAAGEPNYSAKEGVDYIPVTRAGVQTLNGLQATAYCRIRYVGNGDFERTQRQRTVLAQIAKKAITLNPAKLNSIAKAVSGNIKTSLDMSEILGLLADAPSYTISESAGFPFEESVTTGRVGSASVVIPVDLNKNVSTLHKFLFNNENYEPSEDVKKCSEKIVSDTGVSASQ